MWSNYFKSTFRNLRRNLSYTLINIIGLSIALSIFIALALYIQFELSFDNFHKNGDRIYRIEQTMIEGGRSELMTGCPTPLWKAVKNEFPEITHSIRLVYDQTTLTKPNGDAFETRVVITDNEFFELFSFDFLLGDPKTALNEPLNIVITETM